MDSIHYKVMWKFPKQAAQKGDYEAENLTALMKMLRRSEDVSVSTTELFFIHQHCSDGSVLEVLAHDRQQGVSFLPSEETALVPKPIEPLAPVAPAEKNLYPAKYVVAASGLYCAQELR